MQPIGRIIKLLDESGMNFPKSKVKLYRRSPIRKTDIWRLVFLLILTFSLMSLELYEYFWISRDPYHWLELGIYFTFIVAISILIEVSVRSKRGYMRMTKILKYKHNLSLELALKEDWSVLTSALVAIPGRVAENVEEVFLLIRSSPGSMLEIAANWENGKEKDEEEIWNPLVPCPLCMRRESNGDALHVYVAADDDAPVYCFPIKNSGFLDAIFRIKLTAGKDLSLEEKEIFANIGDEIAVALRASQDRKRLMEMQVAEMAIAERRIFSAYVHDQLGQNLGYLHLKLDQLNSNSGEALSPELREELKRLQEVANSSYEIVRDILKKTQPETSPHLTNLLRQHARIIAQRANFDLDFQVHGKPMYLLPDSQRNLFYIFREILNNIEKHAAATQVVVRMDWNESSLDIAVSDNGKGFDPAQVTPDEHFGLEIMQERISSLDGKIRVESAPGAGTSVFVTVPLKSLNLVKT